MLFPHLHILNDSVNLTVAMAMDYTQIQSVAQIDN